MKILSGSLCTLAACFMLISGAYGATVVFHDTSTTAAISILSLDVNGTLYDVSWERGNLSELITAGHNFPFLGDQAGASDAVDAIAVALEAASATAFRDVNINLDFPDFVLPYAQGGTIDTYKGSRVLTPNLDWYNAGLLSVGTTADSNYAVMAISSVPIPAAVWLFGSGFLGLIGISRRKRVS